MPRPAATLTESGTSSSSASKRLPRVVANWGWLAVLVALGLLWLVRRVAIQIQTGPGWDTYAFLLNALDYAGQGVGYTEADRPPLLSMLVAAVFRSLGPSEEAIFWVDAGLFLAGTVGFSLLVRHRFGPLYGFLGGLLLLSYPAVQQWVGVGYTDPGAVALSVWALYFLVLAVERDGRWHLAAWPLLAAAVLTRNTAVLVALPMVALMIMRVNWLAQFRHIAGGAALAALLFLLPGLLTGNLGQTLGQIGVSGQVLARLTVEGSLNPTAWRYLEALPQLLAGRSGLVAGLIAALCLGGAVAHVMRRPSSQGRQAFFAPPALGALYAAAFLTSGILVRNLALALFIAALARSLTARRHASAALDVTAVYWLLANLDFHTYFGAANQTFETVQRYFIPMAPPLTYLLLLAGYSLRRSLAGSHAARWRRGFAGALAAAPIVLLALSAQQWAQANIVARPEIHRTAVADLNWLKENRPNWRRQVIYSDSWPQAAWHLGRAVNAVPSFSDPRGILHELEKARAGFYLTSYRGDVPGYRRIHAGQINVYERERPFRPKDPLLFYLGRGWDTYITDLLEFQAFLVTELGQYKLGRSLFVDNYSLSELQRYPVVLAFGVKWHDRAEMERLLTAYVVRGGTLVFDASGNMEEGPKTYQLTNTSLFGVLIQRRGAPVHPNIRVRPELSLPQLTFGAFVDEGAGTWHGTTYRPLPQKSLRTLATLDGEPLVAVQRMGKGRVVWIGYNLVWHAFLAGGPSERRLVQRILTLALGRPLVDFGGAQEQWAFFEGTDLISEEIFQSIRERFAAAEVAFRRGQAREAAESLQDISRLAAEHRDTRIHALVATTAGALATYLADNVVSPSAPTAGLISAKENIRGPDI